MKDKNKTINKLISALEDIAELLDCGNIDQSHWDDCLQIARKSIKSTKRKPQTYAGDAQMRTKAEIIEELEYMTREAENPTATVAGVWVRALRWVLGEEVE